MIVELRVENLVLIEATELALGAGFTALTGETGAGKSLLIDAVQLALGGRADLDQVRQGASLARVSMVVAYRPGSAVDGVLAELGVTPSGDLLRIVREISEGRSSARVNGKVAPISGLRRLGDLLVDLHGQHDHQALLDPSTHVEYLDAWIGEAALRARARVSEAFGAAQTVRARLDASRRSKREIEQRLDLLRFQTAEIEGFGPLPGEALELEARIERLRHAEKLREAAAEALRLVSEGEPSSADQAAIAAKAVAGAVRYDGELSEIAAGLEEAVVLLREAGHGLAAYLDGIESDPRLLDDSVARLDGLRRLFKKYGDDEAAVLSFAEAAQRELDELTGEGASEEALVEELDRLEERLRQAAEELTAARVASAERFSACVAAGLRELAMEQAQFEVQIGRGALGAGGQDVVEFLFSANAGEPPRPLSKIASGGELSRTMLAIRSELASRGGAGAPTLIFDEVDAGLGGRAAAAVARKLRSLASAYQVIVISHLPQIASQADAHFRIEKREEGGRVRTLVKVLDGEERVEEIARMLAGDQITGPAMANARELMLR
jgi:DNA repair protein RecN (Recombination protein N)